MTTKPKETAPDESKIPKEERDTDRNGDARNGTGEDNHHQDEANDED